MARPQGREIRPKKNRFVSTSTTTDFSRFLENKNIFIFFSTTDFPKIWENFPILSFYFAKIMHFSDNFDYPRQKFFPAKKKFALAAQLFFLSLISISLSPIGMMVTSFTLGLSSWTLMLFEVQLLITMNFLYKNSFYKGKKIKQNKKILATTTTSGTYQEVETNLFFWLYHFTFT